MFSSGQYYKQVPMGRLENIQYRQRVRKSLNTHERRQRIMERCRQDIFYWISTFVYQFNPNPTVDAYASVELGPFISWDKQEELIREILTCLQNREDLVIEKSREMGASWICLLVIAWFYLFHPWRKFLVISRNADAVDKAGDTDSLFWKIDFIIDHLPQWMTAGHERQKMGFRHSRTHSAIDGQATTSKAGVGGRAFGIFMDEYAQIREARQVLYGTANTSGCRIFNSTHLGTDTAFYEISKRPDWKKFVLHWMHHPDKRRGAYRYSDVLKRVEAIDQTYRFPDKFKFVLDGSPSGGPFPGVRSPWYDDQCKKQLSPLAVAMNLDINPSGAVAQFADPIILRELRGKYCEKPRWEGELELDRDSAQPRKLVKCPNGRLKLWIHPLMDGVPPASYKAGVDTSEGTGATNSCVTFFDADKGEKVGEYCNPFLKPEEFAVMVVALCRIFRTKRDEPAKLAWETQGPGSRFGEKVIQLGFRQIYYRENEQIAEFARKPTDEPGWYPSPQNKTKLLADYRLALYTEGYINRCEMAMDEFEDYRYDERGMVEFGGWTGGDDYSQAGVNHGDRVIADALSWLLARANPKLTPQQDEQKNPPVLSLLWRRQYSERLHDKETSDYTNP